MSFWDLDVDHQKIKIRALVPNVNKEPTDWGHSKRNNPDIIKPRYLGAVTLRQERHSVDDALGHFAFGEHGPAALGTRAAAARCGVYLYISTI